MFLFLLIEFGFELFAFDYCFPIFSVIDLFCCGNDLNGIISFIQSGNE